MRNARARETRPFFFSSSIAPVDLRAIEPRDIGIRLIISYFSKFAVAPSSLSAARESAPRPLLVIFFFFLIYRMRRPGSPRDSLVRDSHLDPLLAKL